MTEPTKQEQTEQSAPEEAERRPSTTEGEEEAPEETGGEPEAAPATPTETAVETKPRDPAKGSSLKHKLAEIPVLIVLAFVIAVIIKTFLVQAFYIPSGSMFPTLHVGDRVLVEKVSDLWTGPRKGDIVVFERDVFGAPPASEPWYDDAQNFVRDLLGLPTGASEDYIKRVVAVGGDTLRYTGNPRLLVVNGEPVDEPFVNHGQDQGSPSLTKNDCERLNMEVTGKSCRVPAGTVFVMGDNRGNSEDSRIIGPISVDKIVGKAFMILWPPGSLGTL